MNRCPPPDQLAILLRESGEIERLELESHVRTCTDCQETLAVLRDDTDVASWRRLLQLDPPVEAAEQSQLDQLLNSLKSIPFVSTGHPEFPFGSQLGNYELLDKLGEGGMGVVYQARHRHMDRIVALKVLSAPAGTSIDATARFRREVQAAARLSHLNIVTVFDADEVDGVHFLAMELVEGCNLSRYVREQGPFSPSEAVHLLLDAARGLEHAHSKGILHRDIKPSNLMLWNDSGSSDASRLARTSRTTHVKILDLGLAAFRSGLESEDVADAVSDLTRCGMMIGTVDYMSPEQALDSATADVRSDIYSLGCTLYFLLTAEPPYPRSTVAKSMVAHREEPVPRLRERCSGVPEALESVFQTMMAKQPEARYQTMNSVIEALTRLVDSPDEVLQENPPDSRSTAGLIKRLSLFATGIALLCAMLAIRPSATSLESIRPLKSAWQPGSAAVELEAGILRRPATLPGIDRWQVETVVPRNVIYATSWNEDGSLLAVSGADRQIRIFDTMSHQLVQLLTGHSATIAAIDWHPHQRLLASAARDGTVRVWDFDGGVEQHRLSLSRVRRVTDVAWSPDGNQLAISADDARVHIWTPDGGEKTTQLKGHGSVVNTVDWNPDGTRLVTGGSDGTVRIWKVTGELDFTTQELGYPVLAVDWQGDWIAAGGSDAEVRLWQADETQPGLRDGPVLQGPAGGLFALQWSQDGRQLAASGMLGDGEASVHVWNDEWVLTGAFNAGAHVNSLAWSPGGTEVAVSDWHDGAVIWSKAGRRLWEIGDHPQVITDLSWNGSGTALAVATANRIRILSDGGHHEAELVTGEAHHLRAVDWLNDGTLLAAYLAPDGSILYWSGNSIDRQVAVFEDDKSQQLVLDVRRSDGLAAIGRGSLIRILSPDASRGDLEAIADGVIAQLSWNPRDHTLASITTDGILQLWNENGLLRTLWQVESGASSSGIAWHPSGRQLTVASLSKFWQVSPRGSTEEFASPFGTIQSFAWNQHDELASAHSDGTIAIWNDQLGLQAVITAHTGTDDVTLAWHPDGVRLAMGGRDEVVRVWDTRSGQPLWTAVMLPDNVSVTFDAGGQLVDGDMEQLESHIVYVVEHSGSRHLLRPQQFDAQLRD